MRLVGLLLVTVAIVRAHDRMARDPSADFHNKPPEDYGNILFWMPAIAKSTATSVIQLANSLSQHGHRVTVVVTAGLNMPWDEAVEIFEAESEYIDIGLDYSREDLKDGVTMAPPLQRILNETVVTSNNVLSQPAFREVIDNHKVSLKRCIKSSIIGEKVVRICFFVYAVRWKVLLEQNSRIGVTLLPVKNMLDRQVRKRLNSPLFHFSLTRS